MVSLRDKEIGDEFADEGQSSDVQRPSRHRWRSLCTCFARARCLSWLSSCTRFEDSDEEDKLPSERTLRPHGYRDNLNQGDLVDLNATLNGSSLESLREKSSSRLRNLWPASRPSLSNTETTRSRSRGRYFPLRYSRSDPTPSRKIKDKSRGQRSQCMLQTSDTSTLTSMYGLPPCLALSSGRSSISQRREFGEELAESLAKVDAAMQRRRFLVPGVREAIAAMPSLRTPSETTVRGTISEIQSPQTLKSCNSSFSLPGDDSKCRAVKAPLPAPNSLQSQRYSKISWSIEREAWLAPSRKRPIDQPGPPTLRSPTPPESVLMPLLKAEERMTRSPSIESGIIARAEKHLSRSSFRGLPELDLNLSGRPVEEGLMSVISDILGMACINEML